MAVFTWHSGTSGNWNVTTDWKGSKPPPGAGTANTDVAIFGVGSAGYKVTVKAGTSYNVATIDIAGSKAHPTSLEVDGSLTVSALVYGPSAAAGAATISVGVGGVFDIAGTQAGALTSSAIQHIQIDTSKSGTGGILELGSVGAYNADVQIWFTSTGVIGAGGVNHGEVEYNNYPYGAVVTHGVTTISQYFGNVQDGSTFVFDGANFTGDTYKFSGKTLSIYHGTTEVLALDDINSARGFNWQAPGVVKLSGDTISVVCYAAGTRILTATGERMIESLLPGDIVLTLADGALDAQPVKWIGRRRIDLVAHPRPHTVAPVRIRRGAIADAMPHADLLLSPDHAILIDGKLIAVRQLINGATIRQETDVASVTYYHVELENHAILLAEGLPAESYLDTGNRGFFANAAEPLVLHPDLTGEADAPAREALSCAPFIWDGASVRPVWQRLAVRAESLGESRPVQDTTADADLRIVVKGRTVRPMYAENGLHIFVLPRGTSSVRLASRSGAPTDASPWLEDRRTLGVYVERIVLRGSHEVRDIPLDHPGLGKGWWQVEQDGAILRRWTDGDAVLPLPTLAEPAMLEIRAGSAAMVYVTASHPGRQAA